MRVSIALPRGLQGDNVFEAMEPLSSQPPLLEYATAATPVPALPLLAKFGFAFAILGGAVMLVIGVGVMIITNFSGTDGLLALAVAAVGAWIMVLTWLAFERCSRSASLTMAILATLGTIALIAWLLPVACSWKSWKDAIGFAVFAALLPFMTGVAAYAHWRWAKLLGQPVRIAEAGKEQARRANPDGECG